MTIICYGVRFRSESRGTQLGSFPWRQCIFVGEAFFSLFTLFLNNLFSAPKSGPRNLQVYNATSNSLTVKWDPASGRVQKYRITYQPSTGEGNEQTVICLEKRYLVAFFFSSSSHSRCFVSQTYCCESYEIYCISWNYLASSLMEPHSIRPVPQCIHVFLKTVRAGLSMRISRFLSLFVFSFLTSLTWSSVERVC